ncbi:hypothetical protein CCACVL1_08718 [Corchorus capsularis]|uniref:Uncharacterized protein n=1 Tax=Corchorus capsularis TaxID=210143 RepID=A0A1R3IZ63_COCAP|nr:hypothetical protein CCACVL1_08718 [Corchorus capsularis]
MVITIRNHVARRSTTGEQNPANRGPDWPAKGTGTRTDGDRNLLRERVSSKREGGENEN